MKIEKFMEELDAHMVEIGALQKPEDRKDGRCIACGEPFSDKNVFTIAGWKETKISQLCEKCFDGSCEECV